MNPQLVMFFIAIIFSYCTNVSTAQQRTSSQNQIERCQTTEADAALRAKYPKMGTTEDFEDWLAPRIKALERESENKSLQVQTIPIIFHIIHNGEAVGTGRNIAQTYVNAQVQQLNDDFRKVAGTCGESEYDVAADTKIEFCLALIDEAGKPLAEPGINRVNRHDLDLSAPPYNKSYIQSSIKPATVWNTEQYFNVWVMDYGSLGYAEFPQQSTLDGLGYASAANTDGCVVRYTSLGSCSQPSPNGGKYNLGRTLTHEVGHWLGLRHIWGDGNCSADDYCADTPTSDNKNFGCQTGHVSCSTVDMVENYMDYSDDACMNTFTNDQKIRMQTVLRNSPRRDFSQSPASCQPNLVDNCPNTVNPSLDFDGVNDYVARTNITGFNANKNTVEAWIYVENLPSGRTWPLFIGTAGHGQHWLIKADGSTQIGAWASGQHTPTLPVGQWTHIATVSDGWQYSLYINGVLYETITVGFNYASTRFRLGHPEFTEQYFDGKIDEVRVWNTARTGAEIAANFKTEIAGSEDGLILYYNMNDGTPDANNTSIHTVSNAVGGNNTGALHGFSKTGTSSNWSFGAPVLHLDANGNGIGDVCETAYDCYDGNTYDSDGDLVPDGCDNCPDFANPGLDFDGTNDVIAVSHTSTIPIGNTKYTVEAWFFAHQMGARGLVGWGQYHSINRVNALRLSHNGFRHYWWGNDLDVTTGNITNEWHHVAVTYDGTKRKLYFDGVLRGEDEPGTHTVPNANNLTIGKTFNNEYFDGKIDEVRIWNTARSAAAIKANLNKELSGTENGLVLYYNLNEGTPAANNTGLTTIQNLVDDTNTGTLSGFSNTGNTSNWTIGAPVQQLDANDNGVGDACETVYGCYVDEDFDVDEDLIPDACDNCPDDANVGIDFDGHNDYIKTNNISGLNLGYNDHTTESWVYIDEFQATRSSVLVLGQYGRGAEHWLLGNNGHAHIAVWNMPGTGFILPLPTKEWVHIATVFEGGDMKLYLNGELHGTSTGALDLTNKNLNLGKRLNNSENYFDGKLDEVRIWNTAKSADDIKANLHKELAGTEDGLILYYNMNEGTPSADNTALTSVQNLASDSNAGTLYGFGKTGTSSNWTIGAPVQQLDANNNGIGDVCEDSEGLTNSEVDNRNTIGSTPEGSRSATFTTATFFPNPTKAQTTLAFKATKTGTLELQLIDITGKLVQHQSMISEVGNHQMIIDTSDLLTGTYFARLISSNGDMQVLKLVVQQ